MPSTETKIRTGNCLNFTNVLIAVTAFAVAALLRIVHLGSYPATHPDEGFWASGAKNFVLYGNAGLDGRLHHYLSFLTFAALSGIFSFFPVSLLSARSLSVVSGLGILLLVSLVRVPARQKLFAIGLLAFGSTAVLSSRVILIESHQTFWMLCAATAFLYRKPRFAGLLFALALLVKVNSIYLLPAFLLTGTRRERINFSATFFLAAAGAYGLLALNNPADFYSAFKYEVDGQHFTNRWGFSLIGRWGINPEDLLLILVTVLKTDPVLWVLGGVGIFLGAYNYKSLSEVQRFFLFWALSGSAFTFGQVYVPYRYLVTIMPAFAFLASYAMDQSKFLLRKQGSNQQSSQQRNRAGTRVRDGLMAGLVALTLLVSIGRIFSSRYAATYWDTVAFLSTIPTNDKVIGAPYIGLSIKQPMLDIFRMKNPYPVSKEASLSPNPRTLQAVITEQDVQYVIVDAELKTYISDEDNLYLQQHSTGIFENADFSVRKIDGSKLS